MVISENIKTTLFLCTFVSFLFLTGVGQDISSPLENAFAKEPAQPSFDNVNQSESEVDTPSSIFDFTMTDIDGNTVALSQFKGKVIMVVNTASFCGNTPQYDGLQTLYEQYRDQGFTILAFPANDFGKQEPGTNKEIAEFCYTKYALEFPLFSKITVLGENKHPLYQYLTEETPFRGEIKWNFQKFLIDRSGQVIARYRPGMKPLTPQIVEGIESALVKT